MGFIAGVGFLGFVVFIVIGLISLIKRNGKAKKNFGIAVGLFVLFMIGVVNSDSAEEATTEAKTKEGVSKETKEEKPQKEEKKKDEKAEEKKPAPSSVSDVLAVVKIEMSDKEFKKVKEGQLNVEHPKSISVGNGNVGYVLQATDGLVVANTDGEKIFDVVQFKTMDEVDHYEKDSVAKAEAKRKEEAKKEREASKIALNGSGDTASDAIKLKGGWAIFEGTHNGGANFIVQLQDANGDDLELLVNTIGSYKGKTFAQIPADGDYFLNINADGAWNFNIYQSPPADVADAPATLQGNGDDVVFFNAKSDTYKFTFTHKGQGNFIVLLNGEGLMVNEIGSYSGSTRQNLGTDGFYALVINADGAWTAKVEK
jgi:sortase (surface protein transpeptidase)